MLHEYVVQQKFHTWFAALRNNRRSRAIIPLLHEISSDESNGEGDMDNLPYPASSGDDTNAPGSAPEGPGDPSLPEEDSSAPDPAVPTEGSQEG